MLKHEFDTVKVGDELYVGGRTSYRGQKGVVVRKTDRKAEIEFEDFSKDFYSYYVLFKESIAEKRPKSVNKSEELVDITLIMNIVDNVDTTVGIVLGVISHISYIHNLRVEFNLKIERIQDNTVTMVVCGLPKWYFDEFKKFNDWSIKVQVTGDE